ncbi:MAG: hypothetical protein H0V10_06125, partial [Geodermatophilaceae bacterium]|nr:hypothetical protein [Geodermatophilaceae bacterium]
SSRRRWWRSTGRSPSDSATVRRPGWTLWQTSWGRPGYHLLPAVRADLLRRAGRNEEAAAAYAEALTLVRTAAERRFLERRLREIGT